MIGAYLFWDRSDPGPQRASAFSGCLSAGTLGARTHRFHGALLCNSVDDRSSPLCLADGRALLFTGFLANRRELRRELGAAAGKTEDGQNDDAALYAAARDRWGDAAENRVIGEYAVILVPHGHGPVELLRSPIQAPALYLWRDTDRLIVASHVQAIFATGEVPRKLDEQKLADSLLLNYTEERRGWFDGVARLPRATRALAERDRLAEKLFWRMEDIAPIRFKRDSDYIEALDALFREATADLLEGFKTPSISLSGGLDSQTVAIYAMEYAPDTPLLAGTGVPQPDWVPPDKSLFVDESAHVRALAETHPQLRLNWITSTGKNFSYFQREMFEAAMAPPRNSANLHWIHDLHREMRNQGADVVLSGGMGNLTFSYDGTPGIHAALRRGDLVHFCREIWYGGPRWKAGHRFLREGLIPWMPYGIRSAFHRWRDGDSGSPLENWSPIHPDFARERDVFARAHAMGMDISFLPLRSSAEWRHALLSRGMTEGGDIKTGIDRLHGLPSRDPTAHRRLLEFCFAIPDSQYLYRGRKRWLARRLMRGRLPGMVLNEHRRGRQSADWFIRLAPAREALVEEIDWLMGDTEVAGRIDLGRLRQALVDMPAEESAVTPQQVRTLRLAVSRGLTTARFIRYINGRNDI